MTIHQDSNEKRNAESDDGGEQFNLSNSTGDSSIGQEKPQSLACSGLSQNDIEKNIEDKFGEDADMELKNRILKDLKKLMKEEEEEEEEEDFLFNSFDSKYHNETEDHEIESFSTKNIPLLKQDLELENTTIPIIPVKLFRLHALTAIKRKPGEKDEKGRIENILREVEKNGEFRYYRASHFVIKNLRYLQKNNPHASHVIQHVLNSLLWAAKHGLPKKIKPILLVGEPGVGKSNIAEKIAKAMTVPNRKIAMDSIQSGAMLVGSDKIWGNTQPGVVFDILCMQNEAINPVIILDEVDKASKETQYPPLQPMPLS